MPKADKQRRGELSELNEEVAKRAVDEALDDLMAAFSDVPAGRRLSCGRPASDLIRNVALFLATGEEENAIVRQPVDTARDVRFRRYMVNVMVSNGDGAQRRGAGRSRSSTRPTAISSAASSTSPRWARWSPTSC